ncbi:MAG TPA: type II secretion system F family protein [Verrucomicrobia bacterium]|nr:type II secretion system F family protein [Verrucomicrobiota bacterium]HOB31985.1 type II secretion system F family protein [Verrucomicrobiota bacterium]HOP97568.1 type II secretion system F family protein [Verrucomicrobiota bacterium]HPU55159.1 type II secretion system F family protein [Verrucomicrobiota bacterium]
MPQFLYKARRRTGEVVEGMLDVADRGAALMQIERLGLFPVTVEAAKGGATAAAERRTGTKINLVSLLPASVRESLTRKRRPRLQELATFTQQLANLLHSGMPLTVALQSMSHLESRGIPSDVSKQLRQEVMEGRSLSDSMAKQSHIFSDLYINMVRAGESSGALVDVLRRMAAHFQQFAEVQSRFKSAMVYPAMVCLVGFVMVLFFIFFMLPRFTEMFKGFNVTLPWPTRVLIGVSSMLGNIWALIGIVLGIAVVAILVGKFCKSPRGRRRIDEWKLKLPIFGKVIRLNLFAQFARTLSTLLQNGVPVLTALKITEQVMPNRILKEALAKAREDVTDGKTLAQPLARSRVFPQLMVDLVKIGEETGDVPGALANVADTYEGELQIQLRAMTSLIEPLLIIIMAVVVGFLLASVLLPLFKLISSINAQ